ncbi:MAG: hypothetical protein HYZ17_10460 [Betaproteobacteria bacterium]|nr:hypothetical protein [Betaproteobacteria bacterium]
MFYLELFRASDGGRVRDLLVGGLAINIHGVVRPTMEVDLMLAMDADIVRRFVRRDIAALRHLRELGQA